MLKRLSLLLLTGCMTNDSLRTMSMSQDNVWNLSRLSIGMSESEVLQIMHYPYKKQVLEQDDAVYNIWFYVTRPSGLPQSRLVRQNLTPLTFENGVLQGWGFAYYDYILKQGQVPKSIEKTPDQTTPKKTEKAPDQNSLQHAIEGIEKQSTPKKTEKAPDQNSLQHAIEGIEKQPAPKNIEKTPDQNSLQPMTSQNQESPPKKTKPKKEVKPKKKAKSKTEESDEPLDDEDNKMIEEEQDQNFNFW